MTRKQIAAKLEAIYSRIPKMKDCKGLCEDSCTVALGIWLENSPCKT